MLLGFISFIIFFIQSGPGITSTFVQSFNFADFVMFGVGIAFISQSVWACFANFAVKGLMYKACHTEIKELLHQLERASKSCFPSLDLGYQFSRMRLFKHIFLSAFNLPDEFLFPHYFGVSLDALTADLVDLLPSSYFSLLFIIWFSEKIVRNEITIETIRHPVKAKTISNFSAVFLYGLIGFTIFSTYVYLYVVCSRAANSIISHHFQRQFADGGTLSYCFSKALSATTVNGGFRISRSLHQLKIDLQHVLNSTAPDEADETEELTKKRAEIAIQLKDARREQLMPASPRKPRASSFKGSVSHGPKTPEFGRTQGVAAQANLPSSDKSKSSAQKQKDLAEKKRMKTAQRMAKHAGRINSKHSEVGDKISDILNNQAWSSTDGDEINNVIRRNLPFQSFMGVRRIIDSLRLISNFYIAIYVCIFIKGSKIAMNMGPIERFGNTVGLLAVIAANVLIDPAVTLEYSILRTMGVINPLLVNETIEVVSELERLLKQVAMKILVLHREHEDPTFDEHTYLPTEALLRKIVRAAFERWDQDKAGFLTLDTFTTAIDSTGLFLSTKQMKLLFDRIDCFQFDGQIGPDEFWLALGSYVSRTIDEIQGNVEEELTTQNLHDGLLRLGEERERRREAMLAREAERSGGERVYFVCLFFSNSYVCACVYAHTRAG